MMHRAGLIALGLLVAAWPVPGQAQTGTLSAPREDGGAAKLEEALACMVPCGNGARGTLASEEERGKFRRCMLRRLCTAERSGPQRPVARQPPEELRTRPMDILRGLSGGGRV